MNRTEIEGVLEIDHARGVIYFHEKAGEGRTILRICSLPKPIPPIISGEQLDVTHMHGASWGNKGQA